MKSYLSRSFWLMLMPLFISASLQAEGSGDPSTLTFNLDECTSFNFNDTNSDYSEFTAVIVNNNEVSLSVAGNNLYRLNPLTNRHSCTPGLNGTEAMCISYDPTCIYTPGSERSVRFDIELSPLTDRDAQLQQLSFQEMAPTMFDWIDGPSGLNNYPTFYGLRVLKNGLVIFEQSMNETTTQWSLEEFDFTGNDEFTVSETTTFNFELVAYCPIGAMAMQSVWDLEDISVVANCVDSCPNTVDGGTVALIDGSTVYDGCVGDINVEVTNASTADPMNYYYVITDENDNILAFVNSSVTSMLDLSGAPVGQCHIWGWSQDGTADPVPGENISTLNDETCEAISLNFIAVNRLAPAGGTLTGGPFNFIVDGTPDMVSGITLAGNTGANTQWIVTDDQGNILGLPPMPGVVDFDAAGVGVCYIYSLSYENGLAGLAAGNNLSALNGCFDLSNFVVVNRTAPTPVSGGTLAGGPFTFCVDGTPDMVSGITLNGSTGTNNQWVITDDQGNILGLPPMPGVVDFDAAGAGICLIWNLSYENGLTGLAAGSNVSGLVGDYALSNSITVTRNEPIGGTLSGGPFIFNSIGDTIPDMINGTVGLNGNSGTNSQWIVTDSQGVILGLPPTPNAVDFNGAGSGTCLIWHLSYEDGLTGLEVGMSASNLSGCFDLSNSVQVIRTNANGCNTNGGELFGGPFSFTVGDGIQDTIAVDSLVLANAGGMNSQWVVTDSSGYILGLPPTFSAVNFDGAGYGTCLVWHLSYEMGLTGLAMGLNANDLAGCFSLSNPVTVNRTNANGCNTNGGALFGGPFEFCVGDGVADNIPAGSIRLANSGGMNSQWVVTDDQGNILGLPPMPSAVDFDGAGLGTCLVWHLSYETGLTGLIMGENTANLSGCFNLSNSITVNRIDCPTTGGIVINELNSNGQVEILNTGTFSVDISSYWLCNIPAYDQLSSLAIQCGGDLILDPGELVTVVANFNISETDGELGLYTTNSFGSSTAIIDYVEWGSTGHGRSDVAVQAGIWTAGDFVASFAATESLTYDGSGDASTDWQAATPSPCLVNLTQQPTTSIEYAIYPNPATGSINLKFDKAVEDLDYSIYNREGKVVKQLNKMADDKAAISIEDLPSGMYFLKVMKGRKVVVKPFMKIE